MTERTVRKTLENRIETEKALIKELPGITKYQLAEYFAIPPAVVAGDLKGTEIGQVAGEETFDITNLLKKRDSELKKQPLEDLGFWRKPKSFSNPRKRAEYLCKIGFSFSDAFAYVNGKPGENRVSRRTALALTKDDCTAIKTALNRAGHLSVYEDEELRAYLEKALGDCTDVSDLCRLTGASASFVRSVSESKPDKNRKKTTMTQDRKADLAKQAYDMWLQGMTQEDIGIRLGITRMSVSTYIKEEKARRSKISVNKKPEHYIKNVKKSDEMAVRYAVEKLKDQGIAATPKQVADELCFSVNYASRILNYIDKTDGSSKKEP